MKFQIILLFSLLLSFSVIAQEVKESEVPAKVVSTFKTKFAPSGKTTWNKKIDVFVASFKEDGQNMLATFATDGTLNETKYEIPGQELPGAIGSYIDNNYKDAKIKSSWQRETPTEPLHYYVTLKKEGVIEAAEFWFDMKGKLIKKNVPDAFIKAVGIVSVKTVVTIHPPTAVNDSFPVKVPSAIVQYWKKDSVNYTATFTKDEMTGFAEFGPDGTWHFTKYTVDAKELPGPIQTDVQAHYKAYSIKYGQLVSEPSKTYQYYYVYAKKEGIGVPSVELYYTMAGKFIKSVFSEEKVINDETEKSIKETNKVNKTTDADSTNEATNSEEVINKRELPTTITNYIKQMYKEYEIKSAVLSTTDAGTFYIVKIKKEGIQTPMKLQFDVKGKFIPEEEIK